MKIAKATLPSWDIKKTHYNVEVVKYMNHRGFEKTKYIVIDRITTNIFKEEMHSDGMKGMVYYENELIIHN